VEEDQVKEGEPEGEREVEVKVKEAGLRRKEVWRGMV